MRSLVKAAIISVALLSGCSSHESKAKELFDTAVFEEKQNNFEHAGKLYDEIMRSYPDTKAAKEALPRLSALKNRKP